ncbi:UDP-glucuronosyltransferase 2A1-like isoform X3 [Carassius carassius]|uniref:UDP-glucuronosyltransferase 2A1-like isoform X3 n=1 Tax=Carassius carassius TaxID=217509 RepID=UPI00286916C3|nr:UDP-glucuronosyltransferase 2A1-like isoform X3 [Carassius carassius]
MISGTLFVLVLLCGVEAGKVLVLPGEYSHWHNMRAIIDALVDRNHSVTVLVSSSSPTVPHTRKERFDFNVFKVNMEKEEADAVWSDFIHLWMNDTASKYETVFNIWRVMSNFMLLATDICKGMFHNEDLLHTLQESHYDVLFSDPMMPCSDLMAQKLNIPHVQSLRATFAYTFERFCGQMPAPPSYVPAAALQDHLTDHMSFTERVENMLLYIIHTSIFRLNMKFTYDWLYTEIRVLPGEYSHWHNMRAIIDALVDRNHSVTVLVSSSSPTVPHTQKEQFDFNVFKVNTKKEESNAVWSDFIHLWMNDTASKYEIVFNIRRVMSNFMLLATDLCKSMFHNEDLLHTLQESHYDVLFSDPMMPCTDLMAQKLNIPHVLSLRATFSYTFERFCGQMPAPPSYVPAAALQDHLTDHMSFTERVENMLLYIIHTFIFRLNMKFTFDLLYTEIWGKPTTMCETMGKADIWLIRTYWDFEYPRPLLPNFKFVGGLHCKPAKPLSKELEEFVQSSGDHGIVVFSLGSMIGNLTLERANTIASALGQIPQKVVWRYNGKTPETLAPNTKLYDWIPQNDLLGHPKTKAFITHGGTNGLYEAIYHGVPMVGLPLFADQPDNLMHMKTKGAAVFLDVNSMQSKDLVDALKIVINSPSYKESIMRLSRIHHDQPMKPLDRAVYWIEFVMRHKGAKHLRVQAHDLSWFQYHCLDVVAFLLSIVALITFLFIKTCRCLFRKCFRKTRPDAKAQKHKKE